MSKNSIKSLVVCVIAIIMVLLVAKTSFAVENIFDLKGENNALTSDDPNTPAIQIEDGNIPEANTNNNTNKLENTTVNNQNKSTNAPTTTPYTGIGDYSTYIFIGIFAISAIYAFKKIRDYNA